MIVRIVTEGQYKVDDDILDELNRIDNALVDVVAAGDRARFQEMFNEMLGAIRSQGTAVASDDLTASDVIVPPPDTTIEEAREYFVGDGVIPG